MNKLKELYEPIIYLYGCQNKIDLDKAELYLKDLVKYYNSKKDERNIYIPLLDIEKLWYEKLQNGVIDYSVYSSPYYFVDLIACYWIYSRNYIKSIKPYFKERKISSVMDLGCGLGLTSIDFKIFFNKANVYATNIKDTPQWYYLEETMPEYNVNIVDEDKMQPLGIDLIFASEYFEHFITPIEHLIEVVKKYTPKYFVIANSFNTKSIGHFINYMHLGMTIPQDKISRMFNAELRLLGYKKEKANIWNDKPSIWKRNEP